MNINSIDIKDLYSKKIIEGKRYDFGDKPEMVIAITELPLQNRIWIKTEFREMLFTSNGELIGSTDYVKRAIIAEDEPDLAQAISDLITMVDECFFTTIANDGRQAYKLFKEFGADLLVTDHNMPIENGDWLISEVRKINPKLPILLVTAYDDIIKQYEDKQEHNVICLRKPIDPDELMPIIEGIFK